MLDSIHMLSGEPDFADTDVSVHWDSAEQKVGLFIKDTLWAVFDLESRTKYGGSYKPGENPSLPPRASAGFEST